MKTLQFELWEECNCNCSFCYLGNNAKYTLDDIKINNIQKTLDTLNNIDCLKDIDCIALIGGEFFQGQLKNKNVKKIFLNLIDKINFLLINNYIKNVWISASLIYGLQLDLYETLEHINDKEKIWILTSYDTNWRFKTTENKNNWINNLHTLRNKYPTIHINITAILTGHFIHAYLNGMFELKTIANNINAAYFLKPPCQIGEINETTFTKKQTNIMLPDFFPTRNVFLKFLNVYRQTENELQYLKLYNMKLRSDILYKYSGKRGYINKRLKDKSVEIEDNDCCIIQSCGHSTQYQIYVDSNACCICDKEFFI